MLSLMVFVKQLSSLAENKTEHKQTSKVIHGFPGLFIIFENFRIKNLQTLKTKPANISLLHEKGEKGNHFDAIIIKPMIESVIAGFGFSQGPNIIKLSYFKYLTCWTNLDCLCSYHRASCRSMAGRQR